MIKIKTPKDIEILREGGKRLAQILHEVAALAKSGVTTAFLDEKVEEMIRAGGDVPILLGYVPHGDQKPFPASSCISINDEVVHGIPNENPQTLKDGDIVTIDVSLSHEKLITDAAVTVAVGSVSPEIQKFIDTTKKALNKGIAQAKAGKRTGDIGYAIESLVEKNGYGIVEVLSGHGVGYEIHEDPFVPNYGNKGEGALLKPGMVIAIEPIITFGNPDVYIADDGYTFKTKDKSLAAHFEHTVVITEKGAEILTQF